MSESAAADEQAKRDAAANGKKPSSVKATAPKIEAEVEDLRYQHHQARLDALALRRDYHAAMEPVAQAEERERTERIHRARAAQAEAEREVHDAIRAEGRTAESEKKKSRQAATDLREAEASGPSRA